MQSVDVSAVSVNSAFNQLNKVNDVLMSGCAGHQCVTHMWVAARRTGLTSFPCKGAAALRAEHAQWVSHGPADGGKSKRHNTHT